MSSFLYRDPEGRVNWKAIAGYYLLACLISWPFFWWRDMQPSSWAEWDIPGFLKTWCIMWGPGIAAIVVLLVARRRHKRIVTVFGGSILRSCAFWLLPLLALAAIGMENSMEVYPHAYPLLVLGGIGFVSVLGEELGWRGYLEDALVSLPIVPRYLLIGYLWELWHFTTRFSQSESSIPSAILSFVIVGFILSLISFVMGMAVRKSRSLIVAVAIHAWIDILALHHDNVTLVVFVVTLFFWLFLLLTWDRKFRASGK